MVSRQWLGSLRRGKTALASPRAMPAWLAPAMAGLADLLDGETPRTLWCIANSDAVPLDDLRRRLDPTLDVVCQYNLCQHAAALAHPSLRSLFLFHMTERGPIHGIAADGTPRTDLSAFGPGSCAAILQNAYCAAPPPVELPIPAFTVETQPLHRLFFRAKPGVIPSAGFASVLLLHLLNLRRALESLPPHPIVLCGFTGQYGGTGFIGHDFHFEQAALAELPNLSHLRGVESEAGAPTRLHKDLTEVFHPQYDGLKRGKAEMLFDVAKLHLAAGDIPAFVSFTRKSAGLNPGLSQLQWLVRSLEASADEAAPGIAGIAGGLGRMQENWASGCAPGLGGASFASDFRHPQAEYVSESTGRRRVLIVNETAKLAFNRWHLGCDLVSRSLVRGLAVHDIDCAGWANGLAGLSRILAHDPEARFDGVVINGEGTLHHNADRAFELVSIGRYLKDHGKPVFLINTVWQGNGPHIEDLIRNFDLVAARESGSVAALARVRPDTRLVPDLCWSADLPGPAAGGEPVAILDCVEPERTAKLAAVAAGAGLPLFVMDRFLEAFHRALSRGRSPDETPRVLRGPDIRAHSGWLGGRFHGVVLALGAGVPILSTPSNTGKIQAMFADIGLKGKLVTGPVLEGLRSRADVDALFTTGPGAYGAGEWAAVRDYKQQARAEIDRLFGDIAACLG